MTRTPPPTRAAAIGRRALASLALLLAAAGLPAADPAARLAATSALVTEYAFKRALPEFRALAAELPAGSEAWAQALFGRGLCAQHLQPAGPALIAEAVDAFRQVAEQAPGSRFAARATLNLGRIAELVDFVDDRPDLEEARRRYQAVIERWGAEEIAGEAALRLAAAWIQTYREDDIATGLAGLERWVAEHPADPWRGAQLQYLGDVHFGIRKDHARALDRYEAADAAGIADRNGKGALWWRMAQLAERELKDPRRAIRWYTRVVTDAPTSGKGWEAQQALRRLGAPVPPLAFFGDDGT